MLGSVVEGRADQLPTAQWLNHDSVVIPSGLWCCSPQTFPSGSLFFYLQFLEFWLRSKEIPSFLISLHFFLCFLLDFMSCNPNCEIYLIANSESLYKNPTFLSLPLKKLSKSTAMKTLKLFSYALMSAWAHVYIPLHIILWHVITCICSCYYHHTQGTLWAYVLTGFSDLYCFEEATTLSPKILLLKTWSWST